MSSREIIVSLCSRGKFILTRDGLKAFLTKGIRYASSVFWVYVQRLSHLDQILYSMSIRRLRYYKTREEGLNDIVSTAYNYRGFGVFRLMTPIQFREEIIPFAELCRARSPRVLVEIGTAYGGVLYILARYLTSLKKIVCIDSDERYFNIGFFRQRARFMKAFAPDKEIHCITGNSHASLVEAELLRILNGDKIDILFIDGDHSYEGAMDDFERYGKYVAQDGVIAFHDIVYSKYNTNASRAWVTIKRKAARTTDLVFREAKIQAGIGVVFNEGAIDHQPTRSVGTMNHEVPTQR